MYLHKTKNGHYTPPCCYFSGELEVVECLPQTFSCGMMVFYAEVLGVKFVERERKNYYQLTLREPELSEWQKKLMECELLKKSPLNKF